VARFYAGARYYTCASISTPGYVIAGDDASTIVELLDVQFEFWRNRVLQSRRQVTLCRGGARSSVGGVDARPLCRGALR
jgi:hypothetical protein